MGVVTDFADNKKFEDHPQILPLRREKINPNFLLNNYQVNSLAVAECIESLDQLKDGRHLLALANLV